MHDKYNLNELNFLCLSRKINQENIAGREFSIRLKIYFQICQARNTKVRYFFFHLVYFQVYVKLARISRGEPDNINTSGILNKNFKFMTIRNDLKQEKSFYIYTEHSFLTKKSSWLPIPT